MTKSTTKRSLSWLLVLAIVVTLFTGLTISAGAVDQSGNWTDSGNYDVSWYTAGQSSYTIANAAEFAGLAAIVNGTATGVTQDSFSGDTITLTSNLDLSAHYWVPIGGVSPLASGVPSGNYFAGTFNGYSASSASTFNTYTLTGVFIQANSTTTNNSGYGLFGYINGGTIENLSIDDTSTIDLGTTNGYSAVGAFAGYTNGTLYNLHNAATVSTDNENSSQTGGIAGTVENTDVSNTILVQYCSNIGAVTGGGRVGGIVGAVYCASTGGVLVDDCYNKNTTITTASESTRAYVGGIVGYCRGYITNSYSYGTSIETDGGHYLAGVVGILQGTAPQAAMSNVYSSTTFTGASTTTDRWLFASADTSNTVQIANALWNPDSTSGLTQPQAAPLAGWGNWTQVGSFLTTTTTSVYTTVTQATASPAALSVLNSTPIVSTIPTSAFGQNTSTNAGYPYLLWELDPTLIPTTPTAITVSSDDPTQIFLDTTASSGGTGTPTSPFNNLSDALGALGNGKTTIYVTGGTVPISASTSIWSPVSGATIKRSDKFGGALFTITGSATVVGVQNIIIDGNENNIAATGALLSVGSGSTLNVSTGATLQNNSGQLGGAISSNSGIINISGGLITGNLAYSGAGIYASGGRVTISGGTIESNSATTTLTGAARALGGAVYAGNSATVTVTSPAVITGNSAVTSTNAGPAEGGAFYITDSGTTVTVTSGTITNNYVQVGTGSGGGSTASAYGGAFFVTAAATLTINGGAISYNNANYTSTSTNGSGGAIYVDATGTATLTGGSLTNNTAGLNGGGVFVAVGGTLNLNGGTISGNTVGTTGFGQGIFADGSATVATPIVINPASGAKINVLDIIYLNGTGTEISLLVTLTSANISTPLSIQVSSPSTALIVAVASGTASATTSLPYFTTWQGAAMVANGNNIYYGNQSLSD